MRWAEGRSVRVAVAQTAPELGATAHNLDTLIDRLGQAARDGAQLIVFPECAVSGYMVDDVDELERLAESIPGPPRAAPPTAASAGGSTWSGAARFWAAHSSSTFAAT